MFDYNFMGSFPFSFKRRQVRPEQKCLPVLAPALSSSNLPSHILIGPVLVICSEKLEMCLGFSIWSRAWNTARIIANATLIYI